MEAFRSLFGLKPSPAARVTEAEEMVPLSGLATRVLHEATSSTPVAAPTATVLTTDPATLASSTSIDGEAAASASDIATASLGIPVRPTFSFLSREEEEEKIMRSIEVLETRATSSSTPITSDELYDLLPHALAVAYRASHIAFDEDESVTLRGAPILSEEADSIAYTCLKEVRQLLIEFDSSDSPILTAEILKFVTLLDSQASILDKFHQDHDSGSALVVMREHYAETSEYLMASLSGSAPVMVAPTIKKTTEILEMAIQQKKQIQVQQFHMLLAYSNTYGGFVTKQECLYRTLQMYAKIRESELLFGCDPRALQAETRPENYALSRIQVQALFDLSRSMIEPFITKDQSINLDACPYKIAVEIIDFLTDEVIQLEKCPTEGIGAHVTERIAYLSYPRNIRDQLSIQRAVNEYGKYAKENRYFQMTSVEDMQKALKDSMFYYEGITIEKQHIVDYLQLRQSGMPESKQMAILSLLFSDLPFLQNVAKGRLVAFLEQFEHKPDIYERLKTSSVSPSELQDFFATLPVT